MTSPAPFTILRENVVTSAPAVGQTRQLVTITYQLAARPPQVLVVPATELPDLVYLAAHLQETEVPPGVLEEGQEKRRQLIQAQINRTPRTTAG